MNSTVSLKRNILVIAAAFPPGSHSGSIRNFKLLKHLSLTNTNIYVLTLSEKYLPNDKKDVKLSIQMPLNFHIIRTQCFYIESFIGELKSKIFQKRKNKDSNGSIKSSTNGLKFKSEKSISQQIKDFITDALTIPDKYVGWYPFAVKGGISIFRNNRIDVIYAIGKPWTGFFVGYTLKFLFKKPLVIDFMDPWKASTWRPNKSLFLEDFQTFLEKFIIKNADFIIANTNDLAIDFQKRLKVRPEKIGVLTSGFDELDFVGQFSAVKEPKMTITHTGSFYKKRNPINFLKAVKLLIDSKEILPEKIRINFIGAMNVDDPQLADLLNDPILMSLIHKESWVDHRKVIEYLFQSDVLLLVQPETFLQIPAKLYEYIVAQKPILALAEPKGAVDNLMRKEGWGTTVDNNNIHKIAEAILNYYNMYLTGDLTESVRFKNIQRYNVKNLAAKLEGILDKVIANSSVLKG